MQLVSVYGRFRISAQAFASESDDSQMVPEELSHAHTKSLHLLSSVKDKWDTSGDGAISVKELYQMNFGGTEICITG